MSARGYDDLHVRPTLRFAFAVAGRPTVLTKGAAYRGATLAAIAKRCYCYHGSNRADDPPEACEYHDAAHRWGYFDDEGSERRRRVMGRLTDIYKVEDAKALTALERPALDLSNMRKDQLEEILVAVDWHLANGRHRPARRRRK